MNRNKNPYVKWILTLWIIALPLIASGCDFLDKGERSNVVIEELTAGQKRVSHYGGDQIQYSVWITCLLVNKSDVSANITPEWRFQIDDDLTIEVKNVRSYFNSVRMPAIVNPSDKAIIDLMYFDDTLANTKFSEEFFKYWHDLKATIAIKDENDHSYKISKTADL